MDHRCGRSRARRVGHHHIATSSRHRITAGLVGLFGALLALTRPAYAQSFDVVGVRAQGMGGAFVAVADDSSAAWWNPAGLATGAFGDTTIEYNQVDDAPTNPVVRGFSVGYPALGLSYYRLPVNQFRVVTPTGQTVTGREDQGVLNQFGISVGQSISSHFVIASTVKLVRAADSHAEIDVGAMISYKVLRIGGTVRNLRQVTVTTDAGNTVQLERQTRAGIALTGHTRGQIETATVSFDADLRSTHTFFGEQRRIAGGGELWTKGKTFGVRAGVSANTIGGATVSTSGGISLALHRGAYIEGQLTGGDDVSRRGWSTGVRLTF